ncbi:MAG: MoaD/ThiS family protein [Candidatus Thermoplasmatota archaeon]|nr:MoaD/ThiS family protein [Candidatus Thermoplasmatota archaeon]
MKEQGIRVILSVHLRDYTRGVCELEFGEISSVGALIDALNSRFPGISMRLLDDQGNVRRYVNIFVDSEDIRSRDGVSTSLSGAREVVILPSVAGG